MFQRRTATRFWTNSSSEDEDMNALYESMPDTFTVYRGVSTGIDHFEDGFSWRRAMSTSHSDSPG